MLLLTTSLMKRLFTFILLVCTFVCTTGVHAQFLKKLKDKVSNAVDGTPTNTSQTEKTSKPFYCGDTSIYTLVYDGSSDDGKFSIDYNESELGIGKDGKGFKIVLRYYSKTSSTKYIVITEKQTFRYNSSQEMDAVFKQPTNGNNTAVQYPYYKFREVAAQNIKGQPGQNGQSIKMQKVDTKNVAVGMEMAKQTEEYKKLSPEEKKEFDEMMKNMPAMANQYNNTMAGTTVETPGVASTGDITVPAGLSPDFDLVVKGKNYGHFGSVSEIVALKVSKDESNVYFISRDKQMNYVLNVNGKKISMKEKGFGATTTPDLDISYCGSQCVVFADLNLVEAYQVVDGKVKTLFMKMDGSTFTFERPVKNEIVSKMTESGKQVIVDCETKTVYADGKETGKVSGNSSSNFSKANLLIGSDPGNVCYYSDNGDLYFANGNTKQVGVISPMIDCMDGKVFINWFRQCAKSIYVAKLPF